MNKKTKKSFLSFKTWLMIWIAGMAGQLAWNIENQWFNTFVYAKIAPDPNIITWMVAISAIVSTGATFLMGTFSDRIGKRKIFISLGYVMWGVSTIVFGLTQFAVGAIGVTGAALLVIFADAIMSFFGSTGNDAGFNSWTTDITNPTNRGKLGAVIAVQPVLSTIGGSLIFGAIIGLFKNFEVNGYTLDYFMMFLLVGVVIILIGILSYFFIDESKDLKPQRGMSFVKSLKKPFNFKALKNNKLMLFVLLIFMVFFISFNIYFPHILNYFLYGTGKEAVTWLNNAIFNGSDMKETLAGAIMAIGMLFGFPFLVIYSKHLNNKKFVPILLISLFMNIIGLVVLFLSGLLGAKEGLMIALMIVGIFFVGTGYMGIYQTLMVWIKNLYPEDMRSQFEGVRMIFYVCIPMFLGSLVGNVVITVLGTPQTFYYEGVPVDGFVPNFWLFLVAIGLALLTLIPILLAKNSIKKNPPTYVGEEG